MLTIHTSAAGCGQDTAPRRYLHPGIPDGARDPEQRPPLRPGEGQRLAESAPAVWRIAGFMQSRAADYGASASHESCPNDTDAMSCNSLSPASGLRVPSLCYERDAERNRKINRNSWPSDTIMNPLRSKPHHMYACQVQSSTADTLALPVFVWQIRGRTRRPAISCQRPRWQSSR
jgi:hypothetical protein